MKVKRRRPLDHTRREPTAADRQSESSARRASRRRLRTHRSDARSRPAQTQRLSPQPGEPIRHVYFPGGGFCSMVTVLEDGDMVEVATIGREGMVGVFSRLGRQPRRRPTMVQGETDTCYRMTVDAFRREMDRRGAFYELLTRFRAGARRVHHAVHRVQCRPLRRATVGALAA